MARRAVAIYREKKRVRRPGIHAKSKTSSHKTSRFYRKNIMFKGANKLYGYVEYI